MEPQYDAEEDYGSGRTGLEGCGSGRAGLQAGVPTAFFRLEPASAGGTLAVENGGTPLPLATRKILKTLANRRKILELRHLQAKS